MNNLTPTVPPVLSFMLQLRLPLELLCRSRLFWLLIYVTVLQDITTDSVLVFRVPDLMVLPFPKWACPEWALPVFPESVVPELVVPLFPELVFLEWVVPVPPESVIPAVPEVTVPVVPELAVSAVPGSAAGTSMLGGHWPSPPCSLGSQQNMKPLLKNETASLHV